ncbi:hypothetical protein HDU85_003550 [Gaertneriomyces sp. JEL0708]|nr:hypothetical protein HDU85_003550 [Gaertneriomyces sp. JEL0708]
MVSPKDVSRKLTGFDFYHKILGSPKYVVAPMVDQSEYAWRLLSKRYGAELCYTPMFHARLFSEADGKYMKEMWQTGKGDRPLIVQFCANDPETLLKAAKLVEGECDAVDINLGCPQHIARRGKYGAYLMDEWELIAEMVKILHRELSIPVTCKIRVFNDVEKTIRYAKMIEEAGCQLLTVHGRLREQKGHKTGLADWEQIKMVKEAVKIPVFANGNILYKEDADRCMEATGVDGVMSAEGNLYNPAIFCGRHISTTALALEYLDICAALTEQATATPSMIRAHLFKLFHASLPIHTDIRAQLAKAKTRPEFEHVCKELEKRLNEMSGGEKEVQCPQEGWTLDERGVRVLPAWVAQPYVRGDAERRNREAKEKEKMQEDTQNGATSSPAADEAQTVPAESGQENELFVTPEETVPNGPIAPPVVGGIPTAPSPEPQAQIETDEMDIAATTSNMDAQIPRKRSNPDTSSNEENKALAVHNTRQVEETILSSM